MRGLLMDGRIITPSNEIITFKPGKKREGDFKIYTEFPYQPWAHSICYIGHCVRLKGEVEDICYPTAEGFQGRGKLLAFLQNCLYRTNRSIEELCKLHKIPDRS